MALLEEDREEFMMSLLALLHIWRMYRSSKIKRKRRWWVRDVNMRRDTLGHMETLFQELKNDPDYFFKYTRMNIIQFQKLLKKLTPILIKRSNRKPLSPEHRLIITLRFLAAGSDTFTLATSFRVGESTVRNVIRETCMGITRVLAPKYLKPPTRDDWLRSCKGFSDRWNLPNCGGAIDGKHITIRAPANSGSMFFNYKKTYSIVLMAICDYKYKFSLVDIGSYGSTNDAGIFEDSDFNHGLMNGNSNMPEELMLLPNCNIAMPCYIVGDDAFPLSMRMLKPYPGSFLGDIKRIFNYRLSRARRIIENSFGILASRWRIFYRPVGMDPEKMSNVVMATICLHNMLMTKNEDESCVSRRYCPPSFVDREAQNGQLILGDWRSGVDQLQQLPLRTGSRETRSANNMRDTLAAYFQSPEGQVPWQLQYIRRGSNRDD